MVRTSGIQQFSKLLKTFAFDSVPGFLAILVDLIKLHLSEIVILAVCFQLKQLKKQPEKNSNP